MKRLGLLRWLMLTLFLLVPMYGHAAPGKLTGFYVSSQTVETEDELPADAITWYKKGSKYYLFLPGAVDTDQMRVYFTGVSEITLDGQTLANGDAFSFTPDTAGKLRAAGKVYTIEVMQGAQIPALYIQTESGSLKTIEASKANKEKGELLAVDENGNTVYDGALAHIKIRGNMSTRFNKKSYTVKLEKSTNMFGFGKAKKWVLIGNARDKSLLRNQITYNMARYVGLPCTPDCRQVDLYINREYRGAYLFSDKVQISKANVDIFDLEEATEELNEQALSAYSAVGPGLPTIGQYKAYAIPNIPDDITGGYLVEYESYSSRYREEPCAYYTTQKKVIVVKDPDIVSAEQAEYIFGFMQGFENAIFADNGIDPDTGKHYSDYVDMDSLVKKFMIEEVSKNYDGNSSSQYFFKPADSVSEKAFCGPVWDYDSAYGSYGKSENAAVLSPKGLQQTKASGNTYWWPRLYQKADFRAAVSDAWDNAFAPAIRILLGQETDESGTLLSIGQYAEQLRASADMNFIRWPMKQGSANFASTGKTYDANIAFLTNFIARRYEFLQKEWGKE